MNDNQTRPAGGTVWVTGCNGMLGGALTRALAGCGILWLGSDVECDISDYAAVEEYALRQRPRVIINAAAYTAVDRAEDEPELARRLNAVGAGNLARVAARLGARLVHISTDYVFDGAAARPYREDDAPAPLGVYGASKLEGERLVLAAAPQSLVLRTAWLYGPRGKNFVETMLRLMGERELVKVVADQHGTPTSTATLCKVIIMLVTRHPAAAGIFHVTDGGATTWFEFAAAIAATGVRLGLLPGRCRVEPCTTADYPTRARRPAWSVLAKEKIEALLGAPMTPWRAALESYLQERKSS